GRALGAALAPPHRCGAPEPGIPGPLKQRGQLVGEPRIVQIWRSPTVIGTLCGLGAAFAWAAGFAAARHGVQSGLDPADIAFHRFVWVGAFLLPWIWRQGIADLGGVGWRA